MVGNPEDRVSRVAAKLNSIVTQDDQRLALLTVQSRRSVLYKIEYDQSLRLHIFKNKCFLGTDAARVSLSLLHKIQN